MKKEGIIKIKEGFFLNFPSNLIPITLFLIFLFMIEDVDKTSIIKLSTYILLILFLLLPIIIKTGIQVDTKNKEYRKYKLLYFIFRIGKWEDISHYPYISILTSQGSKAILGPPFSSFSSKFKEYEITLLNTTHLKQIKLKTYTDYEKAKQDLDYFAKKIGVEITTYAPKGGIYIKH